MAIVVGTQARIIYKAETTRGVTPAAPFKLFRSTGRNLNLKRDTLESAEVSSSRQRADVRLGAGRVEGDLGFELSMTTYDDWLAYLMARPNDISGSVSPADDTAATLANHNGWFQPAKRTNVEVFSVTPATSTAPGIITFRIGNAGASTNWLDLGYRVGDWVVSDGFTDEDFNTTRLGDDTANAGAEGPDRWRVMNITTNVSGTNSNLVCQIPAGFTDITGTEAAGAGKFIDYAGRKLSIGTTLTTMTLERGFVEASNPLYQVYPGCAINTTAVSVSPEAIVGGTFGILGGLAGLGLSSVDIDNAASLDASPTAASTNSPFAAFDGVVSTVKSDGTHISATITQCDFTIDNQRSLLPVVGAKFSGDVYEGVAKVTGTVTFLLDSRDHLTAFQDESSLSSMVVRLNELGTTAFMSFAFMRVKYLAADIDPPQNGPVLITTPFEALEQSFQGQGAVITKEAFRIQRSNVS